jgi:hypothetical protein
VKELRENDGRLPVPTPTPPSPRPAELMAERHARVCGSMWDELTMEQLRAATQLGYNDTSWRNLKVSRPTSRLHDDLPKAGRDALRVLGFTREQWDRLRPAVGGSAVGGGTGSIVSAGSTESVQGLVSALAVGPTTGQHRVGRAGCLS